MKTTSTLPWLLALACCSPSPTSTGSSGSGGTSGAVATGGSSSGATASGSGGSSGGGSSGSGGSSTGGTGNSICAVVGQRGSCPLPGAAGTCCGGACVDLATDGFNCGYCDFVCPMGSACQYGYCVATDGGLSTLTCPAGSASVNGLECLPTSCAVAGNGGLCALGDGGGGMCCGDTCAADCASCGFSCGAGQACDLGNTDNTTVTPVCQTCPPGTWPEGPSGSGQPTFCLPTSCDAVGLGAGSECAIDGGGQLFVGTCCEGHCVDTQGDPANCGICGNACPSGSFCDVGQFETLCPVVTCLGAPPDAPCVLDAGVAGACCDGVCLDETTDPQACGGCGVACPDGAACNGYCREPDGGFLGCGGDSSACPAGTACVGSGVGSECLQLGCGEDGRLCAFGQATAGVCCGGACTDLATDPGNCGACGYGSPDGVCLSGDAFPIPADAGTAPICPGFGAALIGPYCADPACACLPGGPPSIPCLTLPLCWLDDAGPGLCCGVDAEGGTCTDVLDDPQNCGACGTACPPGQSCAHGICSATAAPCGLGHTGDFCDLDAGLSFLCCPGGGCTDTRSDPLNCGGCGLRCDGGCRQSVCE